MTPNRIKEIFETRGFEVAMATATACQEPRFLALVNRLATEAARARENRERRAAENRARCRASGGGQQKEKKAA